MGKITLPRGSQILIPRAIHRLYFLLRNLYEKTKSCSILNTPIMKNFYWIFYFFCNLVGLIFLNENGNSHSFFYQLGFVATLCFSMASLPFLYAQKPSPKILITLSVFFLGLRLWAIHSDSFHEDDYYRYLVEARLIDKSLNPYLISPWRLKNLILTDNFNEVRHKRLELYNYILKTGFGWMTAIYPPLVIQAFRLAENPAQLGYLFLFSELLVLLVLTYSCKILRPALFAWWLHPLPIIEVYLNKHYDIWIGLAIFVAIGAMINKKYKLSAVGLAMAVHLKGFALVFVPFMKRNVTFGFFVIYTILEGISAYSYPNRFASENSLVNFASTWEFNNGLYTWFRIFMQSFDWISQPDLLARLIFLSFLLTGILWIFLKPIKQSPFIRVSLLFFLFSPVNNPWYLLMSLPLYLVFSRDRREFHFFSLCSIYYYLWIAPDPMLALPLTTPLQLLILLYLLLYLPFSKNYGQHCYYFKINRED